MNIIELIKVIEKEIPVYYFSTHINEEQKNMKHDVETCGCVICLKLKRILNYIKKGDRIERS